MDTQIRRYRAPDLCPLSEGAQIVLPCRARRRDSRPRAVGRLESGHAQRWTTTVDISTRQPPAERAADMSTSLTTTCQKMVILVCHKCGHSWDYTGNSERATCPDCEVKVPVEEVTLPDIYERQKHLGQKLSGLLQRTHDYDDQLDEIAEQLNTLNERLEKIEQAVESPSGGESPDSDFRFDDRND